MQFCLAKTISALLPTDTAQLIHSINLTLKKLVLSENSLDGS